MKRPGDKYDVDTAARAAGVPLVPLPSGQKRTSSRSEPRAGTRVAVRETCAGNAQESVSEKLVSIEGRPSTPAAASDRVLIVDDDMPLREQMSMALASAGHEVVEAADASTARALLKAGPMPRVVVLDMGLPPHPSSPQEGLRLLDEFTELGQMQVIILTGQGERRVAREAVRLGAMDYLLKPVPMEQLISAVRRAAFFADTGDELADLGHKEVRFTAELGGGLDAVRDAAVRQTVRGILKDTGFNVYRSAQILGIKRETLYYFIRKYGLRRDSLNGEQEHG